MFNFYESLKISKHTYVLTENKVQQRNILSLSHTVISIKKFLINFRVKLHILALSVSSPLCAITSNINDIMIQVEHKKILCCKESL
jgi:hypothetical protein